MKSASAFVVPAATLLLLLSAASLAYQASDARDATAAAQSAAVKARRDEQAASAALRAIAPAVAAAPEALRGHAEARTVNDTLATFVVAVNRQSKARSISLERITSATGQQQAYAGPAMLAREVPLTGGRVRAVRLSMQGRYGDYSQFKRFLDDLAILSAIQSLKLVGDHFEAVTEIYGVAS